MRTEAWGTKGCTRLLALLMLLAAAAVSPVRAGGEVTAAGTERATEAIWEEAPADEIERWWGVAGAALCGGEIRLIIRAPALGMNPYALAAGIAGCSLAALDIFTTK